MGFPQGAVSNPLLWNFFTTALDENAIADDFHALATNSSIDELVVKLNSAAEPLRECGLGQRRTR